MNSKKVLMIHEVREWMFDLPLHEYVLTFDDGLYSQYYYLEKFLNIDTDKYFFISTSMVCPEEIEQSEEFLGCREAHRVFFETGLRNHYMRWSQIKKISRLPRCTIGGHSHFHLNHKDKKIGSLFRDLVVDTEIMLDEFKSNHLMVNAFCFPYNKEHFSYKELLKKYGFEFFFGSERLAIESLKNG